MLIARRVFRFADGRPRFRFAKPRKTLGIDPLFGVDLVENLFGNDIT